MGIRIWLLARRIRAARHDDAEAIEAILLDTYRAVWEPRLAPDVAAARARDNAIGAYVAERLAHLRVAERVAEREPELLGVVD